MPALKLETVTAEAFAPFGQILPARKTGEERLDLIEEVQNLRETGKARLSLAAVEPKALPLTAVEMERHIFSSQAFIPYDSQGFLVLVAPHGADGLPDVSALRAFRFPGNVGVNYSADTWHHPLTAIDGPSRFVVLTFVDGTETDEQFVSLPEPVTIEA